MYKKVFKKMCVSIFYKMSSFVICFLLIAVLCVRRIHKTVYYYLASILSTATTGRTS